MTGDDSVRAVLLAALMVASVVTGTVAFAGAGAAEAVGFSEASSSDVVANDDSAEQDVQFTVTVTDSTQETVTVDTSAARNAGVQVTNVAEQEITSNASSDASTSVEAVDGNAEVTLEDQGNVAGPTEFEVSLTLTHDTSGVGPTGPVGFPITAANSGASTSVSASLVADVAAGGTPGDLPAGNSVDQTVSGLEIATGGNANAVVYLNLTAVRNSGVDVDSLGLGELTTAADADAAGETTSVTSNNGDTVAYFSVTDGNDDGTVVLDSVNLTAFDTSGATSASGVTYDVAATMGEGAVSAYDTQEGAPDATDGDFATDAFAISADTTAPAVDVTLTDLADGEPPVTDGDEVDIEVTVTEGVNLTAVSADASALGAAEDVSLSRTGADGDTYVYGATVTVNSSNLSDPADTDAATVTATATDNAGNTGEGSAALELDAPPVVEVGVVSPTAESPAYYDAGDAAVDVTYTSQNASEATLSVGGNTLADAVDAASSGTLSGSLPGVADGRYDVTVSVTNTTEGETETETASGAVVVDTAAPEVSLGEPNVSTVRVSDNLLVNYTLSDATAGVDTATLSITQDGTAVRSAPVSADASNHTFRALNLPDGSYNLSLTATDLAGNDADTTASDVLVADDVAPSIDEATLSDEDGDGYVAPGESVSVAATVADGLSGVASVSANASALGAGDVSLTPTDDGTYNATFTVPDDAPTADGAPADVTLTATDNASNDASALAGSLRLDTVGSPLVQLVEPAGETVYKRSSGELDVRFSHLLENATDTTVVLSNARETYAYDVSTGYAAGELRSQTLDLDATADELADGQYDVTLRVETPGGDVTGTAAGALTVDDTAPNLEADVEDSIVAPDGTLNLSVTYGDDTLVSSPDYPAGIPEDVSPSETVQTVSGAMLDPGVNGESTVKVYYNVTALPENGVDVDSLGVSNVAASDATFAASNVNTNSGVTVVELTFENVTGPFTIERFDLTQLGTDGVDTTSGNALDYELNYSVGTSSDAAFDGSNGNAPGENSTSTAGFDIGESPDPVDTGATEGEVAVVLYDIDTNGSNYAVYAAGNATAAADLTGDDALDLSSPDVVEGDGLVDGHDYVVLVRARDATGNTANATVNRPISVNAGPPTLDAVYAQVEADRVRLSFSEAVFPADGELAASDFAYNDASGDGAGAITDAQVSGSSVVLTLDAAATAADIGADAVTVLEGALVDDGGLPVAPTSAILNPGETDVIAPELLSATTNAGTTGVTVTVSEPLATPSPDDFSVSSDAHTVVDVTHVVSGTGFAYHLELSNPVPPAAIDTDAVTVSGTATDRAGNVLTGTARLNDTVAPSVEGASAEAGSTTVAVAFSEPVSDGENGALTAANFDYGDGNDAGAASVVSVEHDAGDAVATLTLDAAVTGDDIGTDTLTTTGIDDVADAPVDGTVTLDTDADLEGATLESSGSTVSISFTATQEVAAASATVDTTLDLASERSAGDDVERTLDAFDVTDNGDGAYTYTASFEAPRDGEYALDALVLTTADGEREPQVVSATTTVDEAEPTPVQAEIGLAGADGTYVRVQFDEPIVAGELTADDVSIEGATVETVYAGAYYAQAGVVYAHVNGELPTGDAPEVSVDAGSYTETYGDRARTPGGATTIHTDVLRLDAGTNFVSVPAAAGELDPSAFDRSAVESVWTYDGGEWLSYTPDDGNRDDIAALRPGQGYVVETAAATTVEVNVNNVPGGDRAAATPGANELEEGWNLVGHWQPGAQNRSVALSSLGDTDFRVYGQADGAVSYRYETVGTDERFHPGEAYWVFATEEEVYTEAPF